MNIILNEKKYIENMIATENVGKKPSKTLFLMAKYYKEKGMKRGEIYREIESFMAKFYKGFNISKWQKTMDQIVSRAILDTHSLVEIDSVSITKKEFDVVKSIKNKRLERLCFTLLCVAKFNLLVREKSNGWVNRQDKELFKIANVPITQKEQSLMINDLMNRGLITYSKKVSNTNVRVEFIDSAKDLNEEDIAVKVDDYRNLGFLWNMLCGDNYVRCEKCGILIYKKPRVNVKYCSTCSKEEELEKTRLRVEKHRDRLQM